LYADVSANTEPEREADLLRAGKKLKAAEIQLANGAENAIKVLQEIVPSTDFSRTALLGEIFRCTATRSRSTSHAIGSWASRGNVGRSIRSRRCTTNQETRELRENEKILAP
jgi:hypothetical protein